MNAAKKKRLEANGWAIGSAKDFLGLSEAENALVEMKLALSAKVKALRESKGITQAALARRIGSSQSRVAKIEAGDSSVSFDLLLKAFLGAGASPRDVAKVIEASGSR